jgi:hypothetical protein
MSIATSAGLELVARYGAPERWLAVLVTPRPDGEPTRHRWGSSPRGDHFGQRDDEVRRQILQPRLATQGGHRGNDLLGGSIVGRGDMIT